MRPPFSQRTAWPSTPNPLTRALDARRAAGLETLDLTVTNPTQVGLGPTDAWLRERLEVVSPSRYVPDAMGLRAAREAVARHHGHRVDPDRILLTASTSESYAQLFKLLCDPGDDVLVPAPSYPLFEFLAGLESVRLAPYPAFYADGWHLDLDALEAAVGPRTRAIVVVAPNNPTGALLRRHELERITALCDRHGLAIVSDEVFADYVFDPPADRVRTLAGHDGCLTFALSGLSKVCLAPGLKVGWSLVSGAGSDEAVHRLEIMNDTALSVNALSQALVAPLLEARAELQRPLMERVRANRSTLAEALQGSSGTLLEADGGWSAVVRVPIARTDDEWCAALLDRGVFVHPGYFYDCPRAGHLVLSLIVPDADFRRGAEALGRVLRA